MTTKQEYLALDFMDDCEQCFENWTVHPQALPCNECLDDLETMHANNHDIAAQMAQ